MKMDVIKMNSKSAEWAYEAACSGIDCVMQGRGQTAPLFKCSATVKTNGVDWVLVSYSTPIALYTPGDGIVWDCLCIKYGYTATSSQHLYKFVKWLEQKNFTVNAIKRFTR